MTDPCFVIFVPKYNTWLCESEGFDFFGINPSRAKEFSKLSHAFYIAMDMQSSTKIRVRAPSRKI